MPTSKSEREIFDDCVSFVDTGLNLLIFSFNLFLNLFDSLLLEDFSSSFIISLASSFADINMFLASSLALSIISFCF